jgi:hypothetical protein
MSANAGVITDVKALPVKAARDLVELTEARGWKWVAGEAKDSGDNPFVTVIVGDVTTGEQYKITWHTRGTGTYRLFSKIMSESKGRPWHDAPSLTAIRERITLAS